MADLYLDEMIFTLKQFHQTALSADYNYLSNNGANPIPDYFYEALAWQGLKGADIQAYNSVPQIEKDSMNHYLQIYYFATTTNCN